MEERLKSDARKLYSYLKVHGWSKQNDIKNACGLRGTTVRKIASEFAPHFISNTTQGYNVLVNVDTEALEHSINDLRSRAVKINTRADSLQRALDDRRSQQMSLIDA